MSSLYLYSSCMQNMKYAPPLKCLGDKYRVWYAYTPLSNEYFREGAELSFFLFNSVVVKVWYQVRAIFTTYRDPIRLLQ